MASHIIRGNKMTDDYMKRVLAYANAIIGNKKICDNQDETMRRIIESQPQIILNAYGIDIDIDIEDMNSKPDDRLLRYYELLSNMANEEKKIQANTRIQVYAKQLESVIKAYAKYDYTKEGTIVVNGNTFTYNKEKFDPTSYMDEMAKMGESVQGDIFSISLDEDGKVVIY